MEQFETDEDYLMHYGVLGMKWGVRKAAKTGKSYTYESHGQKKYKKKVSDMKAAKANKKDLKEAEYKLEVFKQRDMNRQKYASTTSVGKSAVKTFAVGMMGGGNYNRYRAAGEKRASAILKTVGGALAVQLTGGLSYPIQLGTSRHKELKVAREQVAKKKGAK